MNGRQATSKSAAAPWPPPMHIVTTTNFTPRLYVRNRRAYWIAGGSGPDEGLVVAAVGAAADREQRHHRAVMRQRIERTGADHRHPVHQLRIDAGLGG